MVDKGTEVVTRNNRIHDGTGTGVFVMNKAKAMLVSQQQSQ